MLHKDKTYLVKQYVELKRSSNTIAKELGVDHSTIVKWLRKFGVDVPKTRTQRKVVSVKCDNCHKPLKRYECLVRKTNFCGYECYHSWMVGNTRGENCNNWKGGIARISSRDLKTPEWRELKAEILVEYPLCVVCGNTGNLHVHHIKTRKKYPELVFEKTNAITVCRGCHAKISGNEEAWEEYFTRLVCKTGELLENPNATGEGNQQPSQVNVVDLVAWKVQRLTGEDTQPIIPTRAPDTKVMI